MKKLTQLILPIAFIIAAFNANSAEYSSKEYCVESAITVAAVIAQKADGKEVNFSDLKHDLNLQTKKLESAALQIHAEKFSEAYLSTTQNLKSEELSQFYSRFNRDAEEMIYYMISLCNSSFAEITKPTSPSPTKKKQLDDIQRLSETVVQKMNSYPGCDDYKKMILDNAYSDMPDNVRQRKLEVFYQNAKQLRCI